MIRYMTQGDHTNQIRELAIQFQRALGSEWNISVYGGEQNRFVLDIPGPDDKNLGSVTVNHSPEHGPRWWAPGGFAVPYKPTWFGINLWGGEDTPYEGDEWVERMVNDIKQAIVKLDEY